MATSPSKRLKHSAPAKAAKKTGARAPARKPLAAKPAAKPASKPASKPATKRAAAKPVAPAAPAAAPAKPPKLKLVRDSFTIPRDEYGAIDQMKLRLAKLGRISKKSELLRAGLKLLASLPDEALTQALAAVPSIKTGRPKGKDKPAAAKPD